MISQSWQLFSSSNEAFVIFSVKTNLFFFVCFIKIWFCKLFTSCLCPNCADGQSGRGLSHTSRFTSGSFTVIIIKSSSRFHTDHSFNGQRPAAKPRGSAASPVSTTLTIWNTGRALYTETNLVKYTIITQSMISYQQHIFCSARSATYDRNKVYFITCTQLNLGI